jgi:hypothetical protein
MSAVELMMGQWLTGQAMVVSPAIQIQLKGEYLRETGFLRVSLLLQLW